MGSWISRIEKVMESKEAVMESEDNAVVLLRTSWVTGHREVMASRKHS